MGYKDQKVIRDTRDARAAAFIGQTGQAFKRSIAQGATRRKEEQKAQKEMQQKAQAAVSGRYKQAAEYEKTGNKSLDEQVIAELENAARLEADLHMKAFGPEATTEDLTMYQKTVANNNRDLNDLTMFVGSFDKDIDAAANSIANGDALMPGSGDFSYELAVQQGAPIKLGRGKDGRYSIFGAEGGEFSGKEIQLGKYYDDFEAKGTRYETIDPDYNLVMDEWSKSIIENGDALYSQDQQKGASTKAPRDSKSKVTSSEPGIKAKVESGQGYKNDIIKALKNNNKKPGRISSSVKGAPSMSIEQMYYNLRPNLSISGSLIGATGDVTYDEFINFGGNTNDIYSAFADQVIDNGTYKRGGIKNVVATNVQDSKAAISNVDLIGK